MTKITDLASLRANGKELDKELKEVLAKYGLTITRRIGRITDRDVTFKIVAALAAGEEDLMALEERNWKTFAPMYNLPLDAFGEVYRFGGSRFKVVGLDLTRRRSIKVVKIQRIGDDKLFICTPEDIIEKYNFEATRKKASA